MPVLALALLAGCADKELEQPQGVWPDYLRSESGEISIAAPSGSEFGPADNITVFSSRDVATNMMFAYNSGVFVGEGVISDSYCMLYPYQEGAAASIDGNQFVISADIAADQTGYFSALVDGGQLYTSEWPEFNLDMDWGAGIGVRYYTPIGPVRFDVAMPLKEEDPPVQFYISIGQSF